MYHLEGKYARSREQFEVLQSINPDDLTAHYYLSLDYSQLGMKEQAEQEGVAYADHRDDDPVVGSLAQCFWREHPQTTNELQPYHLNDRSPKPYETSVGSQLP